MRKVLVFVVVVFSLLLLTSALTLNIGPVGSRRRRERGSYRIFPKDLAHWLGWVGLVVLAISASYSALKRGFTAFSFSRKNLRYSRSLIILDEGDAFRIVRIMKMELTRLESGINRGYRIRWLAIHEMISTLSNL